MPPQHYGDDPNVKPDGRHRLGITPCSKAKLDAKKKKTKKEVESSEDEDEDQVPKKWVGRKGTVRKGFEKDNERCGGSNK